MVDTVMIHLAEQVAPGIDVIFLDTGYHFVETIGTRDAVALVHDVNVINVTPAQTVAEQDATWGKDLFARDPDQCCALRKVAPLGAALRPYAAWASGLRRADSAARAKTPMVSWDAKRQADQGRADRDLDRRRRRRYIELNGLMVNPLLEDGYASIGCEPCTVRADRPRRPRPAAGPAWPRPSAGSTCERRQRGSSPSERQRRARRAGVAPPAGATLWFTGLPSAGKSTIAHALADRLAADGHRVQVLDGDEVRPHLSAGLGYSRDDRDINVSRIGWVARLLASHGVVVLVPVIAPYAAAREAVRDDHAAAGVPFAEIFVSTSLEVAESRDVKGLYAKARRGELTGMTGVDDPYERPDRRRAGDRHRRGLTWPPRSSAGGSLLAGDHPEGAGSMSDRRAAPLTELQALESESIHIFREVAATFASPVMLFSGGKDSVVMLHLAAKAFWPAPIPFGLLHVDTGHNFPEVLEYRDQAVEFYGAALKVAPGAGLHRRRPAAGAAGRPAQPAADRAAAGRHHRRASTTPSSAAAAATRSGPGPRSGSSACATSSGSGSRATSGRSCGRSTTAGTCRASTSGCSRCPTGPSWTSGTTSRPRRSPCPRSTTPTSAR